MQKTDLKAFSVLVGAFLTVATPLWAEDATPAPASLSFQYSGFRWSQTSTKFTGSLDSERKTTSFLSGNLADSYLWTTIGGKLSFYFYPFQDANALVSIGYMVTDTVEVGIDLGLNSTRVDSPKSQVSSDLMGGFTCWSVPFHRWTLENTFALDFSSEKTTLIDSTSNSEDTTRVTGTFMKVASSVVIPLAKNASYVGGLWIASDRSTNHTLEAKRNSVQLGLTLAAVRITVE